MSASKIEWTDRSDWNPIRGCTRVSPGCGGPGNHGGCYAEAMAARFSDPGQWGHGFAERTPKGGRWTGKVEIQWDRLELPLRWRTPADIFASSTSDFFHEKLDMDDVAQLFGVMIAAHHLRGHRFQVLTKRVDRMRRWLCNPAFWEIANTAANAHVMEWVDPLDRRSDDARATYRDDYGVGNPPPGIWLGISVENQEWADVRRDDFRDVPAHVKFVSYEPALGPVDWTGWHFVHQIIGGGESGPRARPMHPDWQRATRDYCANHGIAYFLKQWGKYAPVDHTLVPTPREKQAWVHVDGQKVIRAKVEADIDLIEREEAKAGRPLYSLMLNVGKKRAGRLLDGVLHDGFPEVANG